MQTQTSTLSRKERDALRFANKNDIYGNAVAINGMVCFVSRRAVKSLCRRGYLAIVRKQYTSFFRGVNVYTLTFEGQAAFETISPCSSDQESKRHFLNSVINNAGYSDYIEKLYTPTASEY